MGSGLESKREAPLCRALREGGFKGGRYLDNFREA